MSAQDCTVAVSSSSSKRIPQGKSCRQWSHHSFSPLSQYSSEVRSASGALELRTLGLVPTRILTAGTRRPIILNSLMWLKCVLHLEVLHPSRNLFLQSLIAMILAPIEHVSVLLKLLLLLTVYF